MHMFFSWSGDTSQKVAATLREWFQEMLPEISTYFSPDTPAGAPWSDELRSSLKSAQFAIVVVTPDNREQPWLLWEAGALFNHQPPIRVVPFLFHVEVKDLPAPLQSRQFIQYVGRDAEDQRSIEKVMASILEATDLSAENRKRALGLASREARALREQLQGIRQPAERQLQYMLQRTAPGLARLQTRRVAAFNSLGFGSYTQFIARMVEFFRQYADPACDIYNDLQPREYIGAMLTRRKGDDHIALSEADYAGLLADVIDSVTGRLRSEDQELEKELRITFPSIYTIATFGLQNPGRCRRLTVLSDATSLRAQCRSELRFLDGLMRGSDDHYVLKATEARRAIEPLRLHQSDFAIWRCEEITVLTDYYPTSSTLVVSWRLPGDDSSFMDYYGGAFEAVMQSPGVMKIRDYIDG